MYKARLSTLRKKDPGIAPSPSLQPRGLKYWLCELLLALGGLPHRQLRSVSVGRGGVVGFLRLMQTP